MTLFIMFGEKPCALLRVCTCVCESKINTHNGIYMFACLCTVRGYGHMMLECSFSQCVC